MGMMEHPTSTPDPAMGMMEHPTASPGDAMMAPDASMTNSSLPATGAADNTILITLVGAAALLLLAGIGLRQAIARRS
jgi:LPXTG-motif cell wall-anchored protein